MAIIDTTKAVRPVVEQLANLENVLDYQYILHDYGPSLCYAKHPDFYREDTVTQYGITFTPNGDGSVTLNGTATRSAYFDLTPNSTLTFENLEFKDVYVSGTLNKATLPTLLILHAQGTGSQGIFVANIYNVTYGNGATQQYAKARAAIHTFLTSWFTITSNTFEINEGIESINYQNGIYILKDTILENAIAYCNTFFIESDFNIPFNEIEYPSNANLNALMPIALSASNDAAYDAYLMSHNINVNTSSNGTKYYSQSS